MVHVRRRALPLVVLVVAVVLLVLLRGRQLIVLIGVLQALGLAVLLELWRRQGQVLRREDAVLDGLRRVAMELGGRANGKHMSESTSAHAQLRALRQHVAAAEKRRAETRKADRHADREVQRIGRRDRRNDFAQVEGLLNLYARFPPTQRMPGLRDWAISPDLLLAVIDLIGQRRPRTVLELGGGSSTVWLAHVLRSTGASTRIITLEHDPFWADKVRGMLVTHGLADLVDIRLAPLTEQEIDGKNWLWYDPSGWQDLSDLDLVLVDGPPAATGGLARFPAMPLLADRLSAGAVVVMDDAIREDEQQIAELWSPLLEGFDRQDLPVEKKAILFSRGSALAL